ncbi:MAG: aminodeoxychorismate lyase [Caulobacteraceae bacterium]|nr:aminodeoxychorismate lyase [Caulobacteraceae bacterium]
MTRAPRRPARAAAPVRRFVLGVTSGLFTLALIAVIGALGAILLYVGPGPATPDNKPRTVILRKGAGLSEIAGQLSAGRAVRASALFIAAAEATGAAPHLKAGEYAFPSRASLAFVLAQVRAGKVVRHTVTIAEGLPSVMAADVLMADDALSGEAPVPPEGSILPETYDFLRGEDRAALLQRMMDAQAKLLDTLWAQRKSGLPFNSPQEAVTLASIVEKETSLPAERPRIAAVFINRLRAGMPLASDPTIIYAITQGRPLGRGIRQSELEMASPYNTYKYPGLTPTPISNPGRASLAAVLDPPDTDELYFVADGTGGHAFASTYAEHEKNVERWRKVEANRQTEAAK